MEAERQRRRRTGGGGGGDEEDGNGGSNSGDTKTEREGESLCVRMDTRDDFRTHFYRMECHGLLPSGTLPVL